MIGFFSENSPLSNTRLNVTIVVANSCGIAWYGAITGKDVAILVSSMLTCAFVAKIYQKGKEFPQTKGKNMESAVEVKKLPVSIDGSSVNVGLDLDQDGQKSLNIKINLKEVYEELLAKGEAKIEVKTLTVKMDGMKMNLLVDTDKDGEPVIEACIDLPEAFNEAITLKK